MTAYEQRSYPGAAADTVLTADITSGATAFTVTPGTGSGYPDGSGGPFFVIIDWDNSKAEKIRCSGRVNDSFTVAGSGGGRGQDGTSAQAHAAPAKVRACITATDVQESNRAAANTIGQVTTKGDLLSGSGANTLARTAAGANGTLLTADSTQAGGVRWTSTGVGLDATSTLGGVSGTSLAADRTAWTAFTPVLTAITLGNGTLAAAYKQVGKMVMVRFSLIFGTTTTIAGGAAFALPVNAVAAGPTQALAGVAWHPGTGNAYSVSARANHTNGQTALLAAQGNINATNPFVWAAGDELSITGVYEAA